MTIISSASFYTFLQSDSGYEVSCFPILFVSMVLFSRGCISRRRYCSDILIYFFEHSLCCVPLSKILLYNPGRQENVLTLLKSCRLGCKHQHKYANIHELRHEISNNVVCATHKASDQPAHTRSLIRAFASCLNFL